MRTRFYLDVPDWFDESERPACLARLAEAVWGERPVRIRYRSWTAEKEHLLDPLGIVLKGGAWYLVARSAGRERTYRVSRILDLELLDGRIADIGTFDLAAYWTEAARRFQEEQHPERATLRFSPWGIKMMEAFLPGFALAGATIEELGEDGWRKVTVPIGPIRHAAYDLLRFGAEAEVCAPPALREYVAKLVAEMAGMYRNTSERADNVGTGVASELSNAPAE